MKVKVAFLYEFKSKSTTIILPLLNNVITESWVTNLIMSFVPSSNSSCCTEQLELPESPFHWSCILLHLNGLFYVIDGKFSSSKSFISLRQSISDTNTRMSFRTVLHVHQMHLNHVGNKPDVYCLIELKQLSFIYV